jgi:hypothetical protein
MAKTILQKLATSGSASDWSGNVYYDRNDKSVRHPAQRIKIKNLTRLAGEDAGLNQVLGSDFLSYISGLIRQSRRRRYWQKADALFKGHKIVTRGDSWFLYPVFLDEIVDQFEKHDDVAVYSTDEAGETLRRMYAKRDERYVGYRTAIKFERTPSVFVISGGANDVMDAEYNAQLGRNIGRLYEFLYDYRPGMQPKDLVRPSLDVEIKGLIEIYGAMFADASAFSWIKRIICHGYAYAYPDNDIWISAPMTARGIPDGMQHDVVKVLIDKFNDRLQRKAAKFSKVRYVDLRPLATKKSDWFDEIHPTSKVFKKMANALLDAI